MVMPFGYSKLFENPFDLHLAFMRDVTEDVDFIFDLFCQLNDKLPVSMAEIQCGPGYYTYQFNKLGIQSIGIDSSNKGIEFAKSLDLEESKHILWLEQNPTNLSFQMVDICLLPLDTFTYFLNDDEQVRFFNSVYKCLNKGGLLFIEMNHPKDIGYIDYSTIYTLSQQIYPNHILKVEWGINNPTFDLVTGLANTIIRITRDLNGNKSTKVINSLERTNFPNSVKLIAERCSFKSVGYFGGYINEPLTWESNLQLLVFQKKEGYYI